MQTDCLTAAKIIPIRPDRWIFQFALYCVPYKCKDGNPAALIPCLLYSVVIKGQ